MRRRSASPKCASLESLVISVQSPFPLTGVDWGTPGSRLTTDDWRLGTHDSRPALRRDAKALCRDDEDSSLTSLALLRAGAALGMTAGSE
jgi:hypothetical protein